MMENAEKEGIHKVLFDLHWQIYRDALGKIKEALLTIHKEEVGHADKREQTRSHIKYFEELRDDFEAIGKKAGVFRTNILRDTGCSGECHKNSP